HDLPLSQQSGDRKSVPHGLTKDGQMWNDIVKLLRPIQMPAKTRNRLIQNKDRAMPLTKRLHLIQISRSRRNRGFRLHHHASDSPGMLVEEVSQTLDGVVGKLQSHIFD